MKKISKPVRKGQRTARLKWCVYLLRCRDRSLYCGITNEILARVRTHQAGRGAKYTRSRLPLKLVYQEPAKNKSAALKREWQIKQLSRPEKERLIRNRPVQKQHSK